MCGAEAGRRGERDIEGMCGEPTIGDGFWKMKPRILDGAARRCGDGFCMKRQRILEGEAVTSFVWARAAGMRNDAAAWVFVGS